MLLFRNFILLFNRDFWQRNETFLVALLLMSWSLRIQSWR